MIKNGEAPKADKLRGYFTYTNKSLLESLPDGLERVLDLGCGGGTLGNAYKAMNDATTWHGIDRHKPAIIHAKGQLDAAWLMDANKFKPNKTMSKAPYNTIIACSLEQLNDPELCLERHI